MPEFQLDIGTQQSAAAFAQLDAFTRGYLEAAFFTETGYPENGDLESASIADLAPEALAAAIADCAAFQAANAELLETACAFNGEDSGANQYDSEHAGRDFWYTRNGHGCGFWDGDIADTAAGEALSAAARNAGAVDMYRGDNGQIYFS